MKLIIIKFKLIITILFPIVILSGCGDSPEDIYNKMRSSKDKNEIQKLNP